MPTYVYKFLDTGETIEVQQAFTDDALTEAPHPSDGTVRPVRKVFTPVGITFKGNGFYKTDSRGKSVLDHALVVGTVRIESSLLVGVVIELEHLVGHEAVHAGQIGVVRIIGQRLRLVGQRLRLVELRHRRQSLPRQPQPLALTGLAS